jgi:hypothetical protein
MGEVEDTEWWPETNVVDGDLLASSAEHSKAKETKWRGSRTHGVPLEGRRIAGGLAYDSTDRAIPAATEMSDSTAARFWRAAGQTEGWLGLACLGE